MPLRSFQIADGAIVHTIRDLTFGDVAIAMCAAGFDPPPAIAARWDRGEFLAFPSSGPLIEIRAYINLAPSNMKD